MKNMAATLLAVSAATPAAYSQSNAAPRPAESATASGPLGRPSHRYRAEIIALAGRSSDVLVVLGKDNEAVGYGVLCDLATGSKLGPTSGPNPTVRWARDDSDTMRVWIDARAWNGRGETAILMRRDPAGQWTAVRAFRLV